MQRDPPLPLGRPCREPVRGQVARNGIAEENARLVSWAVTRFFRGLDQNTIRAYPREDAQSDAWTGFLRACELWEPCRGALSGYAWRWMQQAMQKGLRAALNLIHSPSRRPEDRVPCSLKDDWSDQDSPRVRDDEVLVLVCKVEVLEAVEVALGIIDGRQALVIRMRLAGSTWTEVSKKFRKSVPVVRAMEQEGLAALRVEMKGMGDLT